MIIITDRIITGDGSTVLIDTAVLIDDKGIVRWIGEPYTINDTVINKFLDRKEILQSDNSVSNKPPMPTFK